MKEMETLVAMNAKITGKLERKLASTKQQLEEAQASAYTIEKENREEISELKATLLQTSIELDF